MAIGVIGSTAWALVMTVTDPIPSTIPLWEPVVHLETEAQCEEIEKAINHKVWVAGVKGRLSAKCEKIEYVEQEKHLYKKAQ